MNEIKVLVNIEVQLKYSAIIILLVEETGGDHPVYVEARGCPEGNRVKNPSYNSKGEHGHPGYWTSRISM